MPIIRCKQQKGFQGILEALSLANSGDSLIIEPGIYESSGTICLKDGVSLIGNDATITHNLKCPAVVADNVRQISLTGLCIEVPTIIDIEARSTPGGTQLPSESLAIEWGVIYFNKVSQSKISGVSIKSVSEEDDEANTSGSVEQIVSSRNGISLRFTENTVVTDCSISNIGMHGIALVSCSTIAVRNCKISNCMRGISVWPDSPQNDQEASTILNNNQCYRNIEEGIFVYSSSVLTIENNRCWGNIKSSGIAVSKDKDSPATSRNVKITGNRCHSNGLAGIFLASATAEVIEENECSQNPIGIALTRNIDSPSIPSQAIIKSNYCHNNMGIAPSHNSGTGIFIQSSTAVIEGNRCSENTFVGIHLARAPESSKDPSSGLIIGNWCHENITSGIYLQSSEPESVESNECWNNGVGIVLGRDPKSPSSPSRANIFRNICHDNKKIGILLVASEARSIAQNQCWGNLAGITLSRDETIPTIQSIASIEGNLCHHNRHSGIVLQSSSAQTIDENWCWGNGFHGISLTCETSSPVELSYANLRNNWCSENGHSGIALTSSHSTSIESNSCWNNSVSGIFLHPFEQENIIPSQANIKGNYCHDNGFSGIQLQSSIAETIEDNYCWNNSNFGIALSCDLIFPNTPSFADLRNNVCFRNEFGIFSNPVSNSETSATNYCFENEKDSIWNGPLASKPLETNTDTSKWVAKNSIHLVPWSPKELVSRLSLLRIPEFEHFLIGNGCIGCLHKAWQQQSIRSVDNHESQSIDSEARENDGKSRLYVCHLNETDRRLEFSAMGEYSLKSRLMQILENSNTSNSDSFRLGVISDDRDHLNECVDWLNSINEFQNTEGAIPQDHTSSALLESGKSISRVLEVSFAERSRAAYNNTEPAWPMFEEELLEGRSKFWERLVLICTNIAMWREATVTIALTVMIFGLFGYVTTEVSSISDAVFAGLQRQVENLTPVDLFESGTLLFFLSFVLWRYYYALPKILVSQRPSWLPKSSFLANTGEQETHWQRWITRRLFCHNIAVVVIREAAEWSDADSIRLLKLEQLRPKSCCLITIIQTNSPELADRALLLPFTEESSAGRRLRNLDGLELLLQRHSSGGQPTEIDIDRILGLNANEQALSLLKPANLDSWSLTHILPLLILGSTPELNFCISRNTDETPERFWPELEAQLLPYARLLSGEEELRKLEPNSAMLQQITRAAEQSKGIAVRKLSMNEIEMIGGAGLKAHLAAALVSMDPKNGPEFLARTAACGVLHALKIARGSLTNRALNFNNINHACTALIAARKLIDKIVEEATLDHVRVQMVLDQVRNFADVIDNISIPRDAEAELAASRLCAVCLRMGLLPMAVLSTCFEQENNESRSIVSCFKMQTNRALNHYKEVDKEVAHICALDDLRIELRELGPLLSPAVRRSLDIHKKSASHLTDLIQTAVTKEDLENVLKNNRVAGQRLIEAIFLVLVRNAKSVEKRIQVADLLSFYLAWGATIETGESEFSNMPSSTSSIEGGLKVSWDDFVSLLGQETLAKSISDSSRLPIGHRTKDIPDIHLGLFDKHCGEARTLIEMHFS